MRQDKSPQGFIDEDIKPLLKIINSSTDYKTTSSCSGRIVLLKGGIKGQSEWVFKSHDKVKPDIVYNIIQNYNEVKLIFDPFILHIACKNLSAAKNLLTTIQLAGFKKTSIISLKNFILEINGTGRAECLIKNNLITKAYIEYIIEDYNKRLLKTKEDIKKLEKIQY